MGLLALQSRDHRDLLDTVDKLRAQGLSRYVDLPQIIVCGDQSAGKSSVLEAISGMSFPTKDNLCTRFATELILRRDTDPAENVSIIPGPDRSPAEAQRLLSFGSSSESPNLNVEIVVETAKEVMGLSETKVFSSDTLRIELCGPTQPHLTMVDLPGLFRAGNKEQSVKDAEVVATMVRKYMKNTRSIILCVVSAKNDFALQDITELARELDPRGIRTLGLITKPDTLDAGSDSEASYIKLARNQDVFFRLGWHVLKNRSYDMRTASSTERDHAEEALFAAAPWTAVDPMHLGVKALRPRLSKVLGDHILQQLPSLQQDVEDGISLCDTQLRRLGPPRVTIEDQRRYLLSVSRVFSRLMTAALEGFYNDPFFGNARTDDGYAKRLRAVVQNTLTDFSREVSSRGQAKIIIDFPKHDEILSLPEISRSDFVEDVEFLMRRSRGCELPGTFSPLIIGELFKEQCQPWKCITSDAKDTILKAVYRTTQAILHHAAVDETFEGILRTINGRVDGLQKDVDTKLAELLGPHYDGHPITYNHYLTDTVQRAQADRNRQRLSQALKDLGFDDLGDRLMKVACPTLLKTLEQHTEPNMERFASDLAVDYMQAYYKVARKKFVDDVSVLAFEDCLLRKLPDLFQPEFIYGLDEKDIKALAADSEGVASERTRYQERLAVLEQGLRDLKRLDSRHPTIIPDAAVPDSQSSTISEGFDNELTPDPADAPADVFEQRAAETPKPEPMVFREETPKVITPPFLEELVEREEKQFQWDHFDQTPKKTRPKKKAVVHDWD